MDDSVQCPWNLSTLSCGDAGKIPWTMSTVPWTLSLDSMDIVHTFHGFHGHCPHIPWFPWTMPMDSVENVQDVHGIYGLSTDGMSNGFVIFCAGIVRPCQKPISQILS